MTHDARVADWLGRSGASVKTGRFRCVIHFLISGSGRYRSLEVSVCSGVSQAVVSRNIVTGLSHIYYTSKANWTYDIISKTRKSNSLSTQLHILSRKRHCDYVCCISLESLLTQYAGLSRLIALQIVVNCDHTACLMDARIAAIVTFPRRNFMRDRPWKSETRDVESPVVISPDE